MVIPRHKPNASFAANSLIRKTEIMKNIKCEYQNDGKIITQPGKFEREPIFAPYYWDLALQGLADRDDGKVFTFRFSFATTDVEAPFRKELQEWLGNRRTLNMAENENGFVRCF